MYKRQLNKRKVLIIEDDNDVREFLKEEVGQYFEVVAEADGYCLQIFREVGLRFPVE